MRGCVFSINAGIICDFDAKLSKGQLQREKGFIKHSKLFPLRCVCVSSALRFSVICVALQEVESSLRWFLRSMYVIWFYAKKVFESRHLCVVFVVSDVIY